MVRRVLLGSLLVAAALACAPLPRAAAPEPPFARADAAFAEGVRPFLEAHCFECHGNGKAKGGADLGAARDGEGLQARAKLYRRAVEKLASGAMPPPSRPLPAHEEAARFAEGVEVALDAIVPEERAPVGRVVLRRLSRAEYDRTVRDWLGVAFDSKTTFPSDPAGHGVDNLGDVMSATPLLLEKYFDAARAVLDRAFEDPALRARLLAPAGPNPKDREAARRFAAHHLRLAFRRPPRPEELEARLDLWDRELAVGRDFDAGARAILASALLSPKFLFRLEEGDGAPDATGARPLSGPEVATRLSYFLWSTMPDAELARAAEAGELTEPARLRAEVTRMLSDPRSRALADGFAAAWLRYGEILDRAVDFRRFPRFNDNLRRAMYEESARTFDALVKEDRSVLELLDASTTFLDASLAQHYGLAPVEGAMRRVPLPDRRRGGVLGWGSVLTVTSAPLRTSPVLRGKYVLETLLGDAPPPPPPNVPKLPADDAQADALSPRERLVRHRADAACASCHARIDPPGFALEHFDGIGAWRDRFQEAAIDDAAELPGGTRIEGVAGLKDALLARRGAFVRAFLERMFVAAVGRPAGPADEALLRRLEREMAAGGYRFSIAAAGIAGSRPFLRREPELP